MNSKKCRKKGMSTVVATMLLVLLTIVAIGIIAGFIIPFVKTSLANSGSCLDYRDYFSFHEKFESSDGTTQKYNCYDSASSNYGASIKTNAISDEIADKVKGFQLVFYKADGSSKAVIAEAGKIQEDIWLLSDSDKELLVPRSGEIRTYVISGLTAGYSKMEVYPMLEGNKACDLADTIQIIACSGVSLT